MKTRALLLAAVFVSGLLSGCRHDATCTDSLMSPSTATLPSEWKDRGLTLPSGVLLCETPSPNDLHFVERTGDTPEARAKQYEEALRKAGFTDWATKSPNEKKPEEVVIHLMKGNERLVFNVYRLEPSSGKINPALGVGFSVGTDKGAATTDHGSSEKK